MCVLGVNIQKKIILFNFTLILKLPMINNFTQSKKSNIVSSTAKKYEQLATEPRKHILDNILNFAKSYEVEQTKQLGMVEYHLN